MTKTRLLTCAIALPMLALAACVSAEDAADPTPKPSSGKITTELVTFGEQLAQIRGHHLVAAELYAKGDTKGAATHTGHPVEELLGAVRAEVAEHDEAVADRLEPALRAAAEVVADDGSSAELSTAIAEATEVVEDAESAVVGERLTTPAYRGSVIAALLVTVGHEYEEAVKDGKIALVAEYQDAYGFTALAKDSYEGISEAVRVAGVEQADEIDEDFETLSEALTAVTPPSDPAAVDDVERAATHIGAELAETVGAVIPETKTPDEAVATINRLLDEILERYDAGDADEAAELAAEVYLENYELIEADVIEHAKDVNAELEPLLGSQLRAKIKAGTPKTELEEMVAKIRELLKDAEEALEAAEEHS